jgi:DNA-binding MarR family transcriptional regulator
VPDDLHTTVRQAWSETHPGLDLSPVELVGLLKHANAMLDLMLEPVFETAPLSSSEFDLLLHLRHLDGTSIARRLAASMGRSAAALSKSLAKLEKRGLVVREANPTDRRAALVTITEAGVAAADEILPRRLALAAKVFDALEPGDRTRIVEALGVLGRTLEKAVKNAS